jgi:hypothetical protein
LGGREERKEILRQRPRGHREERKEILRQRPRGHREERREEKRREEKRREEKRRENVALDRKSPPFAEKREGWGTLKYMAPRT